MFTINKGFVRVTGMKVACGLLLRRYALTMMFCFAPLWVLIAVITTGYDRVYPSLDERGLLVAEMNRTPAMRLLFGELHVPGTLGQLVAWEVASYVMVCIAIMVVLITVSMTRGDEERGLLEPLIATGVSKATSLASVVVVVWGAILFFGVVSGGILTALTYRYEELSLAGGWCLACVVVLEGWAFSAVTILVAQLFDTASKVRGLSLGCIAVTFMLRVIADEFEVGWLRWLSPFGWRDLVAPYSTNRLVPIVPMALICGTVLLVSFMVYYSREFRASVFRARNESGRRWGVPRYEVLVARLNWRGFVGWIVFICALSVLFGAMANGVVDLLRPGSSTAGWVNVASGGGDPVRQFLSLLTKFTALIVIVFAAARVRALLVAERAGEIETILSTGQGRRRLLIAQCVLTIVMAALLLIVSGAVLARVTTFYIVEHHAFSRALIFTLSQFTGVLAMTGICAGFVGVVPRLIGACWAIVAWSAFTQFFGRLLEFPDWVLKLSVLGHQVDVGETPSWGAHVLLIGVGVLGFVVGFIGYSRRDIPR